MSSANQIQQGSYPARIRDYFVDKTQAGAPRINITFDVRTNPTNPNILQRATWSGSLSTLKSKDLVLKTLKICGLQSNSMLASVAKGKASNVLNTMSDLIVEVVNEERETRDTPPKKYTWTYIKYINSLDGIVAKDLMAHNDFEDFVKNTGLDEDFAKLNDEQYQPNHNNATPTPTSDMQYQDIPF